jgi:hypothetical protein
MEMTTLKWKRSDLWRVSNVLSENTLTNIGERHLFRLEN